MNRSIEILVLTSLLIGGCALIPATQTEVNTPLPLLQPSTVTPEITPSALPVQFPEADQIIFTIPNPEVFSGREGEPRPNWLGWGAETFAVAPDGSFWIDDTAAEPGRLLHYSPQGELLKEISLKDIVVYAYSLLATPESIWVLDISSQQPKVVQLSPDGEIVSSVDIDPQIMMHGGNVVANGVESLLPGERGELLLHGINGYTELIDASGEVVTRPLEALAYYGHTYRMGRYDEATRRLPIFVDEVLFETSDLYVESEPFVGFNPDGSFALAGYVLDPGGQEHREVRYYDTAGELLGKARQRPQTFYKDWNHHLAFGPDGSVYQLLSNPDHSVQVLRLGFSAELPPTTEVLIATPTPLTALLPSESAATEEEQARDALLGFFANLSAGKYGEAAHRYGGEKIEYARDPLPGETVDEYWEYICTIVVQCLPVTAIIDAQQVSTEEFIFYVVFMHPDGTRFQMGACCGGDPAAVPPVWQFAYPVQKIDGEWKVMRGPIFTP